MVSKRRLAASLLLLGVAFVGAFHAVVAVAFDTGLASVGAGVTGVAVFALMVVNLPGLVGVAGSDDADESERGDGLDTDESERSDGLDGEERRQ